jgi:hypothetical protein
MNAIHPNNTARFLRLAAILTLGVGGLCAKPSLAQVHHLQMRPAPQAQAVANAAVRTETVALPSRLVALQATMTQVYPTIGANADGTDLWPCFGFSPNPNPDCATAGNPEIQLPLGGAILGFPSHVWKLQAEGSINGIGCDALTNGTTGPSGVAYKPCGQIATWYEDDTFDSTDDLLQRIVVTQGVEERIIYDSGVVDYGPAGPAVQYPVTVILNTDANFGYWPGAASGPNNGNCSGNSGYPLASPDNPGKVYVVGGHTSCEGPVPGPAHFTTYTVLATPTYTQVTGAACASKGVASPCYTVSWMKTDEIHQDFDVFFQ